jgi:hypothetical protein
MPKKKSKTAKAKVKKKKVSEMNQTHAMEEPKKKFVPSTLAQVWGDTGIARYQTMSEEKYRQTLEDYNKSDLQNHAIRIGVLPIDNSIMLKERLLREFQKHVASYRKPPEPQKPDQLSARARQILAEGK